MFVLWRNDMMKRKKKKEHMKKKKWNMRRKKKKKIWCDWIWCNVTKILRINRKQKMWYKNHHKIFRKDAYVTWYRNVYWYMILILCLPSWNAGQHRMTFILIMEHWYEPVELTSSLSHQGSMYTIYMYRFSSKSFCKIHVNMEANPATGKVLVTWHR